MLSATLNGVQMSFVYDSANRLISAGGNTYTYNVEDVRVRNLCGESETTYAYNTNGKLSQLLVKTTDGVITKYVYGLGLIGEETSGNFKTYHFDYRGSTTAITDINGNVTDTFVYDTYGNLISRTGTSVVIFLYNGRDGVVTDDNGLIYMRARYYSPELRRFINADIIAGEISNAVTLNRYAYANGNPISNVDPFGLSADDRGWSGIDTAHTALDAAGLIPGWGMIFDGVNAIWYLFEGDWANAGFSALAFVPVIGDIAGVGKTGYKGVKIGATILENADDVYDISKAIEASGDLAKNLPPQKVIGHFPEYIELSKELNVKPFSIPDEIWKTMSVEEQWAANQKFLDRAIANNSEFNLATSLDKMREGSFYAKEIQYLLENGYKFTDDGKKLIR